MQRSPFSYIYIYSTSQIVKFRPNQRPNGSIKRKLLTRLSKNSREHHQRSTYGITNVLSEDLGTIRELKSAIKRKKKSYSCCFLIYRIISISFIVIIFCIQTQVTPLLFLRYNYVSLSYNGSSTFVFLTSKKSNLCFTYKKIYLTSLYISRKGNQDRWMPYPILNYTQKK